MKKWNILAAAAVLAVAAATFGGAYAADKLKIGFIYVGPIGDLGWSYQHDVGRKAMEKALGDKVETTFLENVPEGPDAERSIEQLARSGHKLIFTTSFGFMDATLKVANKYPDVFFEHATGFKRAKNMSTYAARFYEGRYIQGQIAAKMSKTGVIGYIVSFPIPEVISNINATMLGAQSVNPNMKVKIIWVNSWFDPGKEADAAKALIDQGADILTQHTDRGAARHPLVRRIVRHDQVRAESPAHCGHRLLGRLLHQARPSRARRQVEVRRHLGRPGFGNGRDVALYQHARRRKEDGDGYTSRHRVRQVASVQVPDHRSGRQDGGVQGRRPSRPRPDSEHELVRQRDRRQNSGEVILRVLRCRNAMAGLVPAIGFFMDLP